MTLSDDRPTPTTEDRLVDLLYPEGVDAARLAALRLEVEADPALAEKLRQYEVLRRLVAELPVPEPERSVHYEILRQARAVAAETPPRRGLLAWLSTLQVGPALAGAIGLLLAAGGTMMLTRESADFAPPPASAPSVSAPTQAAPPAGTQAGAPVWEPAALDARSAAAASAPASSAPTDDASLAAAAPQAKPRAGGAGYGAKDAPFTEDPFGGEGKAKRLGDDQTGARGTLGGLDQAKNEDQAAATGEKSAATADRPQRSFAAPPPPVEAPKAAPARAPAKKPAALANDLAWDEKDLGDLAEEADDGIVHGVAPNQAPVVTGALDSNADKEARRQNAPAPRTLTTKRAEAPGGGRAAQAGDETPRDELYAPQAERERRADLDTVAGGAPAMQAPAAPPPPSPPVARPAPEPVAAAEYEQNTGSSPMAKKTKVAEASSGPATSTLDLARMARKVRQWRQAARHYEDFIGQFPNHAELPAVLFETAETYERLGESARALELYRLVARNGGGLGDLAQKRIADLEGQRRKAAAPAKPMPQAAPAADFESDAPAPAERK